MSSTYQAAVCTALTGPASIELRSLPKQKLGNDEIRIKVLAAGVNYPDLLLTRGEYQLKLEPPFIPGMEIAGEVIEVGNQVKQWQLGQRVIAVTRSGGYAEETIVTADSVISLPVSFSPAQGACFFVAAHTAFHALVQRGQLTANDTVLILGATGGVGLAAVQIAHAIGAKVIAVGSNDHKLSVAKSLGADHILNFTTDNLSSNIKSLAPDGVDVIFDPVGGELSKQSRRLIAWGGRYLIVGFSSGEIPSFSANHAILKGYSLIGVRAGEAGRRDSSSFKSSMQSLVKFAIAGVITPHISASFTLDNVGDALQKLADRNVIGRLAIIMKDN